MAFQIAVSFVFGLMAGAVYFAGLWLTIGRLKKAESAPLLLWGSAVVRLAFLIAALIWIMDASWERLLAALGGVILARLTATWTLRVSGVSATKCVGSVPEMKASDANHTR